MNDQSQIGLTGLAVMGANLARNIARNGYSIAVHNRTPAKTRDFVEEFGGEGAITGTESIEEFVAALERPRKIIIMVKAGGARRRGDRRARAASRRGRHRHRRGQLALPGHAPPHARVRRARPALPRHRRVGRRGGRAQRPEHHARRRPRGLGRGRGDPDRDRRRRGRHAVLRLRRPRRRGPLREDGPQRHRVRRHAADRGVLRPAAQRRRAERPGDRDDVRGVEPRRPRVVPDRDHRDGARRAPTRRRASRSST